MKWFRSKSSAAKDGTSGEADAAQAGGGRRTSESTAQASTPKAKPANKFFAKRAAPRGRLGLRWEPIGSAQPAVGEQIVHPTLAETLRWKTEFTPDELDAFELPDLFEDSYVKTGEPGSKLKPVKYFKPIPPRTFLQGMKHMTEVNGKEVRVIERFGKKARVHVVETSAEFIVDTKHVRWADKTRWDGKQDDSSKSFIQREHAKEEMKLAREREGADNLESEWKAAKGTSISEQSGGDHADSADDEADPPRPLCRVEIGKRTALIKGDVDIELTFNKIMAAIPDLRRFKRFVLKEIATAVNYDETRCIFVYTKWDVEPPDDDHASLSTNYVIMRVRILQSSHLQHINAHHPRRIRSAPDIFEALWNQFQDEESILLRGLECSHLLSIRLLIDPYTAEGKEELKCAGLKREHCEGRHRKPVTKFNTTAEACKLFDEKQQLSIAAAAAHAKDQVDHARAALEEDVQAALEDGIITQEEQEVLEQKQAVLKAAEQMHAMLDGAKQIHTEAARDAEKALSNFQQVKTKKHEHALELNGIISEFEHRKAQEEETQEKVGSKLNALITDLETHQETEGKRKEADLLDQMLAEIEAMKIKSAAEKNGRRPGMEEEEEEEENLSEDCSRRSLSGTSLSGTTGSIQSIAQSDLLKLDNRPADLDALIAEMEEQTGQNSFSWQHDSDSGPVAALYRTRYTIMAPAHLRSRAGNVSHVQAADMWVDHDSHEPEPKYKATSKPKYKMSWV